MPKPKKPASPEAPSPERKPFPPKGSGKEIVGLTPWTVLQAAVKAVPALKYALAVLGIVSAIAIIKGFGIDYRVAVFGTIIMLVLMTAVVVFAALSKSKSPQLRHAAVVMMWSFLILVILCAALLFTSAFFDFPKPLPRLFKMVGLIEDLIGGPLVQPQDRTGLRKSTDINEVPGILISQILEGKNFDVSSKVYEIALVNQSENLVRLVRAKVIYRYLSDDEPVDTQVYADTLVSQSPTVVEIPIDAKNKSSREAEEAIYPAVEIPAKVQTGSGRQAVRIQLHYSFPNKGVYHPGVGWNIYYSLSLFDETKREIRVFSGVKWREPDPLRKWRKNAEPNAAADDDRDRGFSEFIVSQPGCRC